MDINLSPIKISGLSAVSKRLLIDRSSDDLSSVHESVLKIVSDVHKRGDAAILETCMDLPPGTKAEEIEVPEDEIKKAVNEVNPAILDSIKLASENIRRFHEAQKEKDMWSIEIREGILAGRISRPIECVGCYVPGGRASYPSSILMTVIPAKVAGVKNIMVATPPGAGLKVPPITLAAAYLAGCDRMFRIGGPWAISAFAHGTETIPKADKIVGPGNKYVTAAKMMVFGKVAIDSPAGPSEALIITDHTANPRYAAFDFLSQCEHDPDSSAVLISTDKSVAETICEIIIKEFPKLPRRDILKSSVARSHVLLADNLEEAVNFANEYAPEHLQIITEAPMMLLSRVKNAGSIFLGQYSPVSAGDYASGTNHVLPTGQYARMFSGLSVDDFIKKPTFQYLSKKGLEGLRKSIMTLAEAEGLPIHGMAADIRFKS